MAGSGASREALLTSQLLLVAHSIMDMDDDSDLEGDDDSDDSDGSSEEEEEESSSDSDANPPTATALATNNAGSDAAEIAVAHTGESAAHADAASNSQVPLADGAPVSNGADSRADASDSEHSAEERRGSGSDDGDAPHVVAVADATQGAGSGGDDRASASGDDQGSRVSDTDGNDGGSGDDRAEGDVRADGSDGGDAGSVGALSAPELARCESDGRDYAPELHRETSADSGGPMPSVLDLMNAATCPPGGDDAPSNADTHSDAGSRDNSGSGSDDSGSRSVECERPDGSVGVGEAVDGDDGDGNSNGDDVGDGVGEGSDGETLGSQDTTDDDDTDDDDDDDGSTIGSDDSDDNTPGAFARRCFGLGGLVERCIALLLHYMDNKHFTQRVIDTLCQLCYANGACQCLLCPLCVCVCGCVCVCVCVCGCVCVWLCVCVAVCVWLCVWLCVRA